MTSSGALDSTANNPRSAGDGGASGPPGRPHSPPRRPRWLETVIALLLIGAVGVVGLSASPALLRAAGLTRTTTTARLSFGHPDRNSIPGVDDRTGARKPGFVFSFEEDEEDDPHGNATNGWPGPRSPLEADAPPVPRRDPGAKDSDRPRPDVKVGISLKDLKLLDQPSAGAAVTATVKEGELLMIVKEQGGWVLVVHSPEMGWARLSEIAVR
jgi:Bacterial SH3 domain